MNRRAEGGAPAARPYNTTDLEAEDDKAAACNEKRRNTVEVVLAWEGARVVRLPKSDVHWLFSLVHSVESIKG